MSTVHTETEQIPCSARPMRVEEPAGTAVSRQDQGGDGLFIRGFRMLLEQYNFKQEVLDDVGPVLVDFWAEWCPPCRMMNPVVAAIGRDFKVCKVNTDHNQALAQKYQASAIPLLLIFHRGEVVRRYEGVTDEATLRAEMEALTSG